MLKMTYNEIKAVLYTPFNARHLEMTLQLETVMSPSHCSGKTPPRTGRLLSDPASFLDFSAVSGQVAVVNFFASWCAARTQGSCARSVESATASDWNCI